jgi:small-conductance mechanosensitive channel
MEELRDSLTAVDWDGLLAVSMHLLIILVVGLVVSALLQRLSGRMERYLLQRTRSATETPSEAHKRVETLARLMRQALLILVWVGVAMALLREIGVAIGPILASVGVLGLAVGFGAQNLVRDFISGFFFILENQVRVGDVAVVNGTGGLVEALNFRTIVLRDLSGVVHVFPNGAVTTLANMTRDWSAYVFDIGISYKENPDRAMALMKEVAAELRADQDFGALIIDDVEIYGVDAFAESGLIIKGRLRTLPIQQWAVGREFLRRLKHRFDAEGVEIPVPHRRLLLDKSDSTLEVELLNQERQQRAERTK